MIVEPKEEPEVSINEILGKKLRTSAAQKIFVYIR
jgi:hypothetical protein